MCEGLPPSLIYTLLFHRCEIQLLNAVSQIWNSAFAPINDNLIKYFQQARHISCKSFPSCCSVPYE